MKTTIYCKTARNNVVSFYLANNGKKYFLFNQKYNGKLWEHFNAGVDINEIFSVNKNEGYSVTKVKTKLPSYIRYIEGEYGIKVLNKSKKSSKDYARSIRVYLERYSDRRDLSCDAQMIA